MSYLRIGTFLLALQCCMLSQLWSMKSKYRMKQLTPTLEIQKCDQATMHESLREQEQRSYSLIEHAAKSVQKLEKTFESAVNSMTKKWESRVDNVMLHVTAIHGAYQNGQLLEYGLCMLVDHIEKEIQFSCDLAKGIITGDLKTILTGNPYAAQQAYKELQDKWPWKHEHTGFAAAHYSRAELEYIKKIGIDVMREAEQIYFSRPDVLREHGYTITDDYMSAVENLARTDPETLYTIKKKLEVRLQQPVGSYTSDERLTYQIQLAHCNTLLSEPYWYEYAILQAGSLPDARAALEFIHIDLLTHCENEGITTYVEAKTYWRTTYGHNLFETAQTLFKNRFDCPDTEKKSVPFDTELVPQFCALKTLNYSDACIIFAELEHHLYEYAGTRDLDAARYYCIENRGYDVFSVAHKLMTSRPDYQPGTLKPLPSCDHLIPRDITNEIATTLNNSYSCDSCRAHIFETTEQVLAHAQQCQYSISPERDAAIKEAIQGLKSAHGPEEFTKSVITLEILISDLEHDIISLSHSDSPPLQHKLDRLVAALESFFTKINEYTHIKEQLELMVLTMRFASDVTVGRLYLSEKDYKARIAQLSNAIKCYIETHPTVKLIRAAHDIACTVRARGLADVRMYVQELNALPYSFAQGCKKALNDVLAKQPFLVTNHNLIVSSRELPEAVTAHDFIVQSHGKIRDVIDTVEKVTQTNVLNEGFIAGTLVNTPHGHVKIEDLRVGDAIYGRDQAGNPYQCQVTDVYQHTIPAYKEIRVGDQRICAAPHQKFYQSETQSWVTADALEVGAIISLDNDTPVEITAIKDVAEHISTYAITVEGHEYTVTQDNIIVHNFDYPECRFYYRKTDDPYPQEEHILCIGDNHVEQECDLIAQGYTLFELPPCETQQQEQTSYSDNLDSFQDFSREGYRDIAMHAEHNKHDYAPAKGRSPFFHEAQELRNSVLKKIESLEKHTRLVPINGMQYAFPEDALADTIEKLSQLLQSPDYLYRLERALSDRSSTVQSTWFKMKVGSECLEKQRALLRMILNGKLLEQLIEIQKGDHIKLERNLDYPLEHLWPWKCEKTFLVPPIDTNEQKFIDLIGINIMEAIEMASIENYVADSAVENYYTLYINGDKEGLKQAQNHLVQSVAQCAGRQARYYTPHLSIVTYLLRDPLHHNQMQQVHKLIPEYHAIQKLYQEKDLARQERFPERLQAINDVKTQSNVQSPYLYDLTSESIVLLQQLNLNPRDYAQCQGNPLQQIVHGECIRLLECVTLIPEKSFLYDYKPHLVNCIEAARDYNQKGYYAQALMIADFCWTFIDYGHAALEGLSQGLIHTAQDAYNNPLEMAATVVAGRGMAVYSLAKLLTQVARVSWDVGSIGAEYLHNPESGIERWNDYIDPLYKAVNSADFSVHNVIKQTTAFAVHWKAQGKLIQGLNGIVNTAQKNLIAWSKQNPFKKAEDILAITPEGIIVKVSAGENTSSMQFSKSTNKTSASSNAKSVAGVQGVLQDKKFGWTTNDYRHFPQKNWDWKAIVEYTKHRQAKYKPGIDIEALERHAWAEGTSVTNRNANYKVFEADKIIGANSGRETRYMRVECNSVNEIHGHPISESEYRAYRKTNKT